MKYTEVKKGPNKGLWKNEDGLLYSAAVAKLRMSKPGVYDPVVKKSPKKKAAKK